MVETHGGCTLALNDDSRRLLALSVYHFVNDGSLTLLASALPVMRVSLGLDFVQIGVILGAGLLATMLLQLLFGSLSDRGHAARPLVLGFASVVFADLIFPVSSAFAQVLIFYVLLRSAAAVYHPVSFASIARTYVKNRTAAFGYQGAIGDLGLMLATLFAGILSQVSGWRIPFWVWGAIGVVLLSYFVITIVRHQISFYAGPRVLTSQIGDDAPNTGSLTLAFAVLTTVSSLTTVSFVLFTGYMPLYFNVIEGLSPAWSTAAVAVWIAIGVFAGLISGRVVSKFGGEAKTLKLMFAIQSILFLIASITLYGGLPFSSGSGLLVRFVAIALTGIPVFAAFPAAYGLLGLRMPQGRLGLAYALNLSLGLLGASACTYLIGYLASISSLAVTLPILLIIAIIGAVGSLKL